MSGEPLQASVLICSRERPEMLAETVESVLGCDEVPAELVIVDQSAEPNEALAAIGERRGCRMRYLHSRSTGLSRARNEALRAASHDVVVLVDDDMFVEPGWLRALLDGRGAGERQVATGRVLAGPPESGAGAIPPAALFQSTEPATFRGLQQLDVIAGANVALPRRLVLELGGYDERLGAGTRFPASDDNDMGHRLMAAGAEVRHVPESVVLHRAWRSRGELVGLRWRYGRGTGAFYAKHASLRDRHVLGRAGREVARRLRTAATSLPRAPKASAGELVMLAGLVAGMLDWALTVRLPQALRRLAGRRA